MQSDQNARDAFMLVADAGRHCFREDEIRIRIISARKTDSEEEQVYWSNIKLKNITTLQK